MKCFGSVSRFFLDLLNIIHNEKPQLHSDCPGLAEGASDGQSVIIDYG